MALLRRVLVEKRVVLVPLALAIVANAAAYALVVYPLQQRVASGGARVQQAEQSRRVADRELAAARATQASMQAAEVQLQQFYRHVLPDSLAGARQAAYVRLSQIAAESRLQYQGQVAEQEQVKGSHLTRLRLRVTLNGTYEDIRRFVHALETAPEFLIIDNIALAMRADQPSAPLVLTLAVSTCYWTGGNAV